MSRTSHSEPTWPSLARVPAAAAAAPDALSDALAGRRFAVFESVREYLTGRGGRYRPGAGVRRRALGGRAVAAAAAAPGRPALGAARLLLLITYRDTETGGRDELTAFLAALARQDAVSRIRLTGLSQDEVAAQLAAVTGARGRARAGRRDRAADAAAIRSSWASWPR